MKHKYAAALVLITALTAPPAQSGQILIQPKGDDFTVTVSIKESLYSPPTPLQKTTNGDFTFDFDDSIFTDGAYEQRVILIIWKRKTNDKPATGVTDFEVEIPVVLRKWRKDDIYLIQAWSFNGIGNRKLIEYEQLLNPDDQWRKLLASLQQADHYAERVNPTAPETRRAYNTAVDALTEIARGSDARWLRLPVGLDKRIRKAFERNPEKRDSLLAALSQTESLIWSDLNGIETRLEGLGCEAARATFDYLDRRRNDDLRAYKSQVGDSSNLLDDKRALVINRACPSPTHAAISTP